MNIISQQNTTSSDFSQTNALPFFRVSTPVIKAAQSDKRLTASSKLVFIKICEYCASLKSNSVNISQQKISKECGFSVRTVFNSIKTLSKFNYLSVSKNTGQYPTGKTNIYTVNSPPKADGINREGK